MFKIEEIDRNFQVKSGIEEDIVFYDAALEPFQIYGLIKPADQKDRYRRMPEETARRVSEGVYLLHTDTAGGRVRFRTDSSCIAIYAEMGRISRMVHFAMTGSAGFDLYVREQEREKYIKTFLPPQDMTEGYASLLECGGGGMREYTVNFPLYSNVNRLYIGLKRGAAICPAEPYAYGAPVVFYGSSITQGGCASRPGNSYESMISRRFHCDYINLGFSGSAKGEDAMAEYIASLKMKIFVYDYDHNASWEELKATHGRMFSIIRRAQPDLPVIMVSRPAVYLSEEERARRDLIRSNCMQARNHGDRRVCFVDGNRIMEPLAGDSGTVDGCHPNDLGFFCMAKAIGDAIGEILKEGQGEIPIEI